MHWLNGETLERFEHCSVVTWDFPVGSNDEESACNMGDLGLIPQSPGEGNGNSFQCSCLENPRDGGAWWAAIYGVTQSRTRLKQLSISISIKRVYGTLRDIR